MVFKKITFKFFSFLLLMGIFIISPGCNKNAEKSPVVSGSVPGNSSSELAASEATGSQEPYAQNQNTPSSGAISGVILIAPNLADKVDPNAVLFISAKPAEGPQVGVPPLASKRIANAKFPMEYTLTSQDVIMGGGLSGKLNIVAKLFKNGAAGPMGPGDIEGHYVKNPVTVGQKSVDITLDTIH